MPLISIISFVLFILFIVMAIVKDSSFFSPSRIFIIVWTFCIGLAELKFSRLQFEWDLFGWFMLLLGLVSFLLGSYYSFVINLKKTFYRVKIIREIISNQSINGRLLFRIIITLIILYFICYLAEYFIQGYLPIFSPQPDKARAMYGIFGIHLIVSSVNAILFLIVEYFILVKTTRFKKWILVLLAVLVFLSFLLLLQRYSFFILGFMILCFLFYSGRHIRFRTLFVVFASLIGFIILIRSLRAGQFAEFYFYTVSQMKVPYSYALISEPYMYLVMNLENFVKNFSTIDNHTLGIFTFDFITAITGLKSWLGTYFGITKFPHYIPGFNTFPFYWVYWYDFGLIGLFVFPFLIGFIISQIYYFLHRYPSVFILSLYCIGFSVIVISYSSDPLTRLDMVFNYLLIAIVQLFISRVPKKIN